MESNKIKDLETIQQVFDKFGVKFYVCYGALLGMHRDGKLIPHDDDMDLAVIDNVSLETRKAIGWTLFDLGFLPAGAKENTVISFNVFGRMEPSEPGYNGTEDTGVIVCERDFKFTIFFFKEEPCEKHGDEYVCVPKLGAMKLIATPKKFFEKPATIKIGKNKYPCPGPINDYLTFTYGNWKKPSDEHAKTYYDAHL